MIVAMLWVAILTAGPSGIDTRQSFPTESACLTFVAAAHAKSLENRGPYVYGSCVRAR